MSRRNEALVGGVILAGIALVIVGTIWLRGTGFGRQEADVTAQFGEVGQLMEGNPVKLRGVPIGRVQEIALAESGDRVLVEMRIDSRVSLPQDPVVILSPESMFGDWQAEISPRSRYPNFAYTEPVRSDLLPGYSLPDISQLTAVADRISDNLATLSERVELAFTEETALSIRQAITNVQQVSEELVGLVARQERTLEQVAGDLETTTRTMGEAASAVNRVAGQVEAAVAGGELTTIVQNVERATTQLDSLTASLADVSGNLESSMASADTAFRSVSVLAERVESGEGTLGMLLRDTTLYAGLVETNTIVQALLADFRENPRKYIRLEIF